jgi:hypothetical protein
MTKSYAIDVRTGKHIEVVELVIPGLGNGGRRSSPPKSKGSFVKIPMAWKDRLFEVGARNARTIMIGVELHALFFKAFRKPFPLTNTAMAKMGIDRHAKYRALVKLEALGLIKVERRPGKSPLITRPGLYPAWQLTCCTAHHPLRSLTCCTAHHPLRSPHLCVGAPG